MFSDANKPRQTCSITVLRERSSQREMVSIDRWNYINFLSFGEIKSSLCSQMVFINRWSLFRVAFLDGAILKWSL